MASEYKLLYVFVAKPHNKDLPKAVHYSKRKLPCYWKRLFAKMYKEKYGLKSVTEFDVEKLFHCYSRDNAILRIQAYASENDCLRIVKKGRKPGIWEKPAPLPKALCADFNYVSFCSDRRFEPDFLPLCERLDKDTKQQEGIEKIADFLFSFDIPTPPVKRRRHAFRTMFCLPKQKNKPWRCGFQEAKGILNTILCMDMEFAPHRTTWNGSKLPDWTPEQEKDFWKRGDTIEGLKGWYELWHKSTVLNKICAQLNKLYHDQEATKQLEPDSESLGSEDEV